MSARYFYSSIGSTQIRVSVSSCRMEASAADQRSLDLSSYTLGSFLFPMERAGRLRWLSRTVRTCRVNTVKKVHISYVNGGVEAELAGDHYGKRRTIDQIYDILAREVSKSAIRRRPIDRPVPSTQPQVKFW